MAAASYRWWPGIWGMVLAVLLALPAEAWAQSLAETGQALAESACSRCHAVGRSGASPRPEAPPFREFARRWPLESLEEAFAEGIVTGHPDMPPFQFDPATIEALIAYLDEIAE